MGIDEIEQIWITSRDASERFGYTSDYVAFLCRTGKIIARRAGRSWEISELSISEFASRARQAEEIRHTKLREERRKEYLARVALASPQPSRAPLSTRRAIGSFVGALILIFAFGFSVYALPSTLGVKSFADVGTLVKSLPFGFERNMASALVAVSDIVSGETKTTTIPHREFSWTNFFGKVATALFGEPKTTAVVQAPAPTSTVPVAAKPVVTVVERTVAPTTVVRNVSEYVTVTGVTYAELEAAIKSLEARLVLLIPQAVPFTGTPPISVVNTQTFAQSQRIDSLDGVTITNATIIGGSISGIGGLGDNVASGTAGQIAYYGATGSSLSATSSIFVSSSQRVGIATTSPLATLTVYGDALFSGANRYLNFGDESGLNGYGIRDNGGIIEFKNLSGAWSSLGAGGSGGGTWSTTTSSVAGVLVNYANNASDIVAIGSTSTTTAEYWFDPNTLMAYFSGRVGLSTSTPFAKLAVQANAGQTNPVFQVASSSSSVNFLTVAADGNGTTTLTGLSVVGSATSTSNVGFNLTGGCFAINGTCLGSSAFTSIGPAGQLQTGPSVTFATSSTAFNGLTASTTITGSGNVITFTNTLAGLLGAAGGGTGLSSVVANQLLIGGAGNTWVQVATSSLGINFANLVGSATDAQVDNNLTINAGTIDNTPIGATTPSTAVFTNATATNATTTNLQVAGTASTSNLVVSNTFRLANLTGILRATAGVISTATIDLVNDVGSSILAVTNGGTGWGNIQANTVVIGNGTGRLATTTAGTNGQVLSLVDGVPSWVATSSINNGVSSLQQSFGSAQTGALTIATTSDTNILLSVTNSGGTFTFTPSFTGTLADSRVADNLTISGGTIDNTPIGATSASTGVFSNSTSTNATSTSLYVSGPFTVGTSPFLRVSNTGFGTTTLTGLTVNGSATSTSNVGINLSAGCFAINNVCVGSSAAASTDKWATSTDTFAIYPNGLTNPVVGIGSTTPRFTLTVASSTRPQLALSDGSLTQNQWTQRAINGNFYLATSSPSTFATSTTAALSIDADGNVGIATAPLSSDKLTVGGNVKSYGSFYASGGYGSLITGGIMLSESANSSVLRGAGAGGDIIFQNSGTTELGRLTNGGNLGLGTTTPQRKLTISDSTASQLMLTDGSLTQSPWNFRSINGTLYIATSSAATFATTSTSALSISGSGFGTTTIRGLEIIGQATSTSNVGINLSGGCFAINNVCVGGGSSNWTDQGAFLTPLTATDGILINSASSTITNLVIGNATSTNATTTNFAVSGALTVTGSTVLANATTTNATTTSLAITNVAASSLLKTNTIGSIIAAIPGVDYLTSAFREWSLTTNVFGQSALAPTTTQNIAVSGIGTSTFKGGLEAWRQISAPYFEATSTSATSTFAGSLSVGSGSGDSIFQSGSDDNGWSFGYRSSDKAFAIASSTNLATNVALSIAKGGFSTTTLSGLTINGSATSTSNVGFNLTGGCFAINNVCVGSSAAAATDKWATSTDTFGIYPNGVTNPIVGIGTTTPRFTLTVASSTRSQIAITDGSLTQNGVAFRTINNNFYIATTSPSTFATSTTPVLSFDTNGTITLGKSLPVASGGTGVSAFGGTNSLLYTTTANNLSSIAAGTGGFVLAMSGGVPTWVATSSIAGQSMWSTTTDALGIYPNGLTNPIIGIGTTTPKFTLSVASSTRPQIALSDGSLTQNQWTQRAINGNFYLATSSPSTFATSTTAALAIDTNGVVTLGSALTVPSGGTGSTTLTTNGVLYGNGTGAVQATSQGPANSILTANAGAPSFSAAPTIGTSVTTPLIIGGTAAGSSLTLRSTGGSGTTDAIIFQVGNAGGTEAGRFTTLGTLGLGTTTPTAKAKLTISTSTTPQLTLTDGSLTSDQWNFRAINNNFYLATSSASTFATSTSAALSFDTNGLPSFGGLQGVGTVCAQISATGALTRTGSACGSGGASDEKWATSTDLFGIYPNGVTNPIVGIGTTTPRYTLTVASSTRAQLVLSDGSLNQDQWAFRAINGTLYIATSSASTFATTSIAALSISGSGFGTTTIRGLDIIGQATTTSNVGINITSGCFARNNTCIAAGSGSPGGSDTFVQFNQGGSFGGNAYLSYIYTSNTNRLGVGSTTPFAKLSVHAHANDTLINNMIFAVASSTASATTTLFSVNNAGQTTIGDPTSTTNVDAPIQVGLDANAWTFGYASANKSFRIASSTSLATTSTVFAINKGGLTSVGTTSPFARLTVWGGSTDTTLFEVANSASTTALSVSATGFGTTTVTGLTITGSASTTSNVGINLSGGCFAINNVCVGGSSPGGSNTDKWATSTDTFAIYPNGVTNPIVGIGTTTPRFTLTVASSTRPQIALTDGSLTADQWTFRTVNGNFYLATSSPSTFATATDATLSIIGGNKNGLVGIGSTTPWAKLSVIGGEGNIPSFIVATTSTWTTNGHQGPLLYVAATTTGAMNYARVAVGTTSPWGNAGLRDQFTVDGRSYTTWRENTCDFMSPVRVQITATTTNAATTPGAAFFCNIWAFNEDTTGTIEVTTPGYPSFIQLRGAATAGAAAILSAGSVLASATTSPVLEAWVRTAGTIDATTPLFMVGFTGSTTPGAGNLVADFGAEPWNGVYFVASSTGNGTGATWKAVHSTGGVRTIVNTGVATSSTQFSKMRVEVTPTTAYFLINGNIVAQITPGTMTPKSMLPFLSAGVTTGGTGTSVRNLDISLIRLWVDDPPGGIAAGEDALPPEDVFSPVDGADIAEAYLVDDPESYIEGTLLSNSTTTEFGVRRSSGRYDSDLIGAITTSPQIVLGDEASTTVRMALVGRVPVIVSDENGPIKIGSRVTSSSVSGVGMRAGRPGPVVGRAIAAFDPGAPGTCDADLKAALITQGAVFDEDACVGRVMVFVDPGVDMTIGDLLQDAQDGILTLADALTALSNEAFEKGAQLTKFVAGQIVAQLAVIEKLFAKEIYTEKLCVGEVCVTEAEFLQMIQNSGGGSAQGGGNGGGSGGSGGGGDVAGTSTPSQAPVITIFGANPAHIEVGSAYADLGASVTDDVDGNLGITTTVDGQEMLVVTIDTSVAGEHTIIYSATDLEGNVGTATRTVIVENTAPTPEPEPEPQP